MKKSTGKVQPKKETVRINLPPKPTAAPTIKLPTLPPGGPTGAPGPAPAAIAQAPRWPHPPRSSRCRAASPGAAPPRARCRATSRACHSPGRRLPFRPSRPLDKILIYAAAVASLAAVGIVDLGFSHA